MIFHTQEELDKFRKKGTHEEERKSMNILETIGMKKMTKQTDQKRRNGKCLYRREGTPKKV